MSTQENSIVTNAALAGSGTNPPLIEVTSQLSPDSQPAVAPRPSAKPQVVFVGQKRQTQIIEIQVRPNAEVQPNPTREQQVPLAPVVPPVNVEVPEESERRFAVDPFIYEVDGPIPVMPAIPIVEMTSTDQVVAREQPGEHYAWRLIRNPHPSDGNASQISDHQSDVVPTTANQTRAEAKEAWTETEVVAENKSCDRGDCFYAQSGDVIAIDGNKGFDHIDLRSYSIDDATFQPGAILLHGTEAGEGEQPEPITIRHRGIDFAVFKGEVRVEL